jgi:putative ABC transport system permease protein
LQLKSELPNFVEKYFYGAEKDNITLKLQPITDIHLKSNLDYEIEPNSNILYIRILMIIAIFVLIIASINFMNIATALSTGRAKK